MKKTVSLFSAVLFMITCILCCYTAINTSGETLSNEFIYEIVNGKVIITGHNQKDKEIYFSIIPEEIDGNPVTAIADNAFADVCIRFLSIPKSVGNIGKNALQSKTFPYMFLYLHPDTEAERYAMEHYFFYKYIKPSSDDNFIYTIENNEAIVTGYVGNDETVTIPEFLGGYPVTAIADEGLTNKELWSFGYGQYDTNNPWVKEVIIPDTIKKLGKSIFLGLQNLEKISLPNNIKTISPYLFFGCTGLKKFDIPKSVTRIEEGAFMMTGLEDITIHDDIEFIDGYAFADCYSLKSVVIPTTVKEIGEKAFAYYNEIGGIAINAYLSSQFKIFGYRGTEAERYALEYGHEFIALDGEQSIPGDANCDGEVSIADVVAVRLYCLDPEKYPFKYNGEANALVIAGQTTVQGNCAIAIQDFVVEKIKMLPIAG